MNIRNVIAALSMIFCFQAAAMSQEQMMMLIQHGSEKDLREFAQERFPVDASFVMNGAWKVTFASAAALLIKDKLDTLTGKAVMGTLAALVACEGIAFMAGIVNVLKQYAEQEKCFQYFMNIRKGLEMRRQAEGLDDSEGDSAGE